jgi:flavodoxin
MIYNHDKGGLDMNNKILVAYFSRAGNNYVGSSIVNLPVGNTEIVAKMIAQLTGGDLFKIDPLKKYSTDYTACTEEAKKELRSNARPQLSQYLDSIMAYDTIVLGFPNYWGTMPMPVWTFLEKYDFSGKTILPLCTHEGSGMGQSESDLKKLCPASTVLSGLAIRGSAVKAAQAEVSSWLQKAGLLA